MANDLEGREVIEQHGEGVLLALEVVERDVAAAVELFERVEDVEAAVDRGLRESLGRGVGVEVPRLHVEHAGGGLQHRLVDAVREGLRAKVEVAIPGHRLLLGRLAAEVAPQRVLVLADDAGHEHLGVRQRDVRERLARLRQQVRLLHLERLQVHHRKHAVHRLPHAVAGRDIIVVLHDIRPVADADELRVVGSLHLRRRHADEPGEHLVGRRLGIPACRQERCDIGCPDWADGRKQQGRNERENAVHRRRFVHGKWFHQWRISRWWLARVYRHSPDHLCSGSWPVWVARPRHGPEHRPEQFFCLRLWESVLGW